MYINLLCIFFLTYFIKNIWGLSVMSPAEGSIQRVGKQHYSNNAKIELLGINKYLILKHGAVSKEVALSMAKNLHRLTRSHICASITGIAGPGGGSKQKPVGTVYFSIS